MLIKKVTLNGFKRFSLSGVDNFEFEPNNGINIFTDRNGAGKSSLLSQLNPLPPEMKKDFKEDGFKIIELQHLGSDYILTSKGNKHSFLKDGEELNPGGTRKVQMELVENVFNINPHVINVINGISPFTLMTPSERKKWLTEISTVDYSYAISIYQKLLERRRDLSAWVKLNTEKTITINSLISSIDNYESLVKEDSIIRDIIERLLKEYTTSTSSDDVTVLLQELKNKNTEFLKYEDVLTKDIPSLINMKTELTTTLTVKQHELKSLLSKYEQLSKDGDKDTLDRLTKQAQIIKKEISTKPETWTLNNLENIFSHLKSKLELFQSVYHDMMNNVVDVNVNLDEMENDIVSKKVFISRLEDTLSKQNTIKSEFNNFQELKLPSCSSCGSPYDVQHAISVTTENIKLLTERLDKEKKELYKKINLKNTVSKRKYLLDKIMNMLKTDEYIRTSMSLSSLHVPTEVTTENLETVMEGLSLTLGMIKDIYMPKLIELEDINKQLMPLLEQSLLSKDKKEEMMVTLNKLIESLTENIHSMSKTIKDIDIELDKFNKLTSLRDEIKNILRKINQERKLLRVKFENDYIENTITKLKEKNVENLKILEQYRSAQKELEILQKERTNYDEQIKIVNILLEILSPSNGIIAKSINSFLGVFINDMNSIINSVWSYKIKILPCDLFEGDDLDYRFKVEINDDFVVEDVIKLSSSMREIVDLAFRLIFIKYKHFDRIPIILDEFGRTMDREHRVNAFNMIEQVICSNFDQVFLVSHFEEMYGRFKNARFASIE